jgi:transcriptional regulator with XRE-family HTH domain
MADALASKIAEIIRSRRTTLGLSQEELGERAGLHRTYIGALERGERNLSVRTLYRVAAALECSPADLLPK